MAWTAALPAIALAAATPSEPITREQALTLEPGQIAELVLRQFADQVESVTRPNYESQIIPGLPLATLHLATRPSSTRFAGLCQASVITVLFPIGSPPTLERNLPVRADSLHIATVYKVIGDISLRGVSSRPEQGAECAQLRGVIPPEDRLLGYRQFFRFSGPLGAPHAVAVLQQLVRSVRDGSNTDHRCIGYDSCTDSGEIIRALDMDALLDLQAEAITGETSQFAIRASFLVSGNDSGLTTNEVTVHAQFAPAYGSFRLFETTVQRVGLIRD